ncbi:MAG: 1,4-dihydroxy-6-naphthoate synthase [Deltaproteobacteria bacterium]|nr:1,4-dihydroxy-6-naphthoate synthase [Deltaproteobacteria bacterium]
MPRISELSLGFSGCPNDTAVFYALVSKRIELPGIRFLERIRDVEELNRSCLQGILDVSKVSFHAVGHLIPQYALLRSGAALGRGCGPLIVSRPGRSLDELHLGRVAVPGVYTTAQLLLNLFSKERCRETPMLFSDILLAVAEGTVDYGLIIHEGRFTYGGYGLVALQDLGNWWEKETGLPIPLGGIVIKRSHGAALAGSVEAAIRQSLAYYHSHPGEAGAFIREHAQEMDDEVTRRHIELYVTAETMALSEEGEEAVRVLLARARERRLIPDSRDPLFLT